MILLTSSGAASAVLAFLLSSVVTAASPSSSSSLLRFCAGSAMPLPATEVRDVLGPRLIPLLTAHANYLST